jgi:hypothetical protein
MKTMSHSDVAGGEVPSEKGFAVETTFVLFFLAVEFGRTFTKLSFDNFLMAVTLLMVIVLPYFLSLEDEKPGFANWILGRTFIARFAILLGALFNQTLGVVLPETFRLLPLTLLIVTAMLGCYIQFYGFLKLRLAQ